MAGEPKPFESLTGGWGPGEMSPIVAGLSMSYEQRFAMLEEMIEIARGSGALRRLVERHFREHGFQPRPLSGTLETL